MTSFSNSSTSSLEEQIVELFAPEGPLSQLKGFEQRPEQVIMARRIAVALEDSSHLMVEAGTGVGKSLAYLLPAALHALRTGSKAIVSTHTIHLQEQLLYKDIPLVENILGTPLEAVLLKGRQNYLCPRRLDQALKRSGELFTPELLPELEKIRRWSFQTQEGSLSDMEEQPDPQLWAQLCSERHFCTPKTCANDPRCHYQQLRKKVLKAPIIILNHTLFFMLLEDRRAGADGFLLPDDFLIIDEAHTIPSVAAQHLGLHLSQYQFRQMLLRLYNPRLHKGILSNYHATKAIGIVTQLLEESAAFFETLATLIPEAKKKSYRFQEKDHRALCEQQDHYNLLEQLRQLHALILSLQTLNDREATSGELRDAEEKIATAHEALVTFMEARLEGHVYWVEERGMSQSSWTLHVTPIEVADALEARLFSQENPLIMTSATLSTAAVSEKKKEDKADEILGFQFFRRQVGGTTCEGLQLGSPFNYEEQMSLHLVGSIPEPRDPNYEKELIPWIERFTEESKASAFVLFTSYQTMRSVAAAMASFFKEKKWQLLVQGEELSRSRMLEAFRSEKPSVLFGTDSFWTGVDIPGDNLTNVIITRLPFTTPDHPLTQAQHEYYLRQGWQPFAHHSLPEAILKFRQGVGRLIRNKQDRGMVAILDSRILNRSYGKQFLEALPPCRVKKY